MSGKRSIFEEVSDPAAAKVAAPTGAIDRGRGGARRGIRAWLIVLFVLVAAMIAVGGLTRLTDSGLISFQLCKAYAPPVGVKGQISTVCLYTAGGNLASKDNFILFYLGRFDGGTVFRCIMISPGKVFLGRIEDEGEIRFQQLRPRFLQCLFQYNRGQ